MTEIPRILIFGQPFNNFSGGGITLTNLFKGWPKDRIAVTYMGHGLVNVATDVCDTYYQLGSEEHKWKFPFNLLQRKFPSGIRSFENKINIPINSFQNGLRHKLVNNYFYPFLRWSGFYHFVIKISISYSFKNWLSEYKPEIIYLQVAARAETNFARDLINLLKIPTIIHVMDDWPSTISINGPFRKYWSRKIDMEFKSLLDLVSINLSISDAMSEEYKKRYNKNFIPFHNPIDIELWSPYTKKDFRINKSCINILYSGRIGDNGIADSITEFASAIDSINGAELDLKLHIQTPTKKKDILDRLRKYDCVVFNPFAEYNQIPQIFSSADILLLANDFSSDGIKYLRYSMPTKASEYMISGTPVLVYAPDITAVSEFFSRNNCGYCITKQSSVDIVNGIKLLIDDEDFRKKLSRNAVNLAIKRFDANKVRSEFQNLIISLKKQNQYV